MFLLILLEHKHTYYVFNFTFHDVSINTPWCAAFVSWCFTLHSTMFLLILSAKRVNQIDRYNFTFHDVSINTNAMVVTIKLMKLSLHSTMFLLIPVVYSSLQYRYNLTTFCQSCHFIIFILIFIFLDSSHF